MINILVISGKSSSGKDLVVKKLVEKGYSRIVRYATRPKRKGEQQDITYHFITIEEFNQKIEEGFFAEYQSYNTEFGIWYYGTSFEDLKNANDKSVIILEPQSYRDIKNVLPDNITCIYLYANNSTIKKRLENRGDNPNEIVRRMNSDTEDFKGFENEVDRIVYNNDGDNIDDVVSKILKYVGETNENN